MGITDGEFSHAVLAGDGNSANVEALGVYSPDRDIRHICSADILQRIYPAPHNRNVPRNLLWSEFRILSGMGFQLLPYRPDCMRGFLR